MKNKQVTTSIIFLTLQSFAASAALPGGVDQYYQYNTTEASHGWSAGPWKVS